MRRLFIMVLAMACTGLITVPARAEEKTVEQRLTALEDVLGGMKLYGSIRFATFYETSSSRLTSDSDNVTKINTTRQISGPDQRITQWDLYNGSRVGLIADRKDGFGGRVELALKNNDAVSLRLGYGTYTCPGGATFLIGQDFTPLSEWDYSSQVFNGDNALAGWGMIDTDGKRLTQVKVKWNGLQVALVNQKTSTSTSFASTPSNSGISTSTEVVFPHVEAKYRYSAGMFFGDIFGGYGQYKVDSASVDIDRTVRSYAAGTGCGVKLDPAYVKGMVWTAVNGKQLGLHQANAAGAALDSAANGYSVINDRDLGFAAVAGVKVSTVTMEAGYGLVSSKKPTSAYCNDKARNYYLNANIPVAQNVLKTASFSIVPEIGVYDYMKSSTGAEEGRISYAGSKWQINF